MTSSLRTISNRINSQKSTGPTTEAGKQRSSLNALRHGLTGQIVIMPSEDIDAYQLHIKSFVDEYNPQGATESNLVQALADASWRLNRIAAMEATMMFLTAGGQPQFTGAPEQVQDAMSVGAALQIHAKGLASLSMHSLRLSRQFERTVTQLRDLQNTRRSQERSDMKLLLDIMEMYKYKGEPWLPSEVGFVFSPAQIEQAVLTRRREKLATKAFRSEGAAL